MDEILQKLLEAEILSEETKLELEEAFTSHITEAVEAEKVKAREEIQVELAEQFVAEREQLVEALDTKVEQYIAEEITELKADIERFRDLEVEYAEKLVESEGEMAKKLETELEGLVGHLDVFLEMRISEEIDELKEDIEAAKKLQFGKSVFEAFCDEYKTNFVDEDSVHNQLKESDSQLKSTQARLEQAEKLIEENTRKSTIQNLLKPLKGSQREIMETLLLSLPTQDLESGYKSFLGRVVKEGESTEKESSEVLSEDSKPEVTSEEVVSETIVKEGNDEVLAEEIKQQHEAASKGSKEKTEYLRRLSGIQ